MCKLSVIIPVYNVAPFLRDCLNSVLHASGSEECVETVCVDDCSTDKSSKILDEIAAAYKSSLIVYHSPVNAGVSIARNYALAVASGEWVTFLDGDDRLRMDVIHDAIEFAEKNQLDVVVFNHKAEALTISGVEYGQGVVDNLAALYAAGLSSCGAVYRKTFLDKHGIRFPENLRHNEDFVFISTVHAKTTRIGFMNKYGYEITPRADSASRKSPTAKVFLDRLLAATEVMTRVKDTALAVQKQFARVAIRENVSQWEFRSVVSGQDADEYSSRFVRLCDELLDLRLYGFMVNFFIRVLRSRPSMLVLKNPSMNFCVRLLIKARLI